MKKRKGFGLLETLLAFAGLAAFGFMGFNLVKTGCPLGLCGGCASSCTTTAK